MARYASPSVLLLVAFATGCASPLSRAEEMHNTAAPESQMRPAAQGLLADPLRLFRVGHPLLRAAWNLCQEDTRYAPGLFAANRYTLGNLAIAAYLKDMQ